MGCLTFQSCLCISLRKGSFIVAYICMVFEAISLIANSIIASLISAQGIDSHTAGYIYAEKFMLFLFMLIICFKIWLCIVLLIGLSKRLPDHLEMWYMGFFLCVLLQTAITVCATIKEYDGDNVVFWLVVSERILVTVITLYFVMVIRSYFFQMCKEPNYYQNITYDNETVNGLSAYDDKPTKNEEEDILIVVPAQVRKTKAPRYDFKTKGGGVVYSTAQENTPLDMPTPFQHNDKQSSMLYPSLA